MTDEKDARADDPADWFASQFDDEGRATSDRGIDPDDIDDEPDDFAGPVAPRSASSAIGDEYAGSPAASNFVWGLKPRPAEVVAEADADAPIGADTEPDADVDEQADVESAPVAEASSEPSSTSHDDADARSDVGSEQSPHPDIVDSSDSSDSTDSSESADAGFPPPPVITGTPSKSSSPIAAVDEALPGAPADVDPAPEPIRSGGGGADVHGDLVEADLVDEHPEQSAVEIDPAPSDAGTASTSTVEDAAVTSTGEDDAKSEVDPVPTIEPTVSTSTSEDAAAPTSENAATPTIEHTADSASHSDELSVDLAVAAAEIPTMEEVLEAPSPRRAAREAAAKEAALREAAEKAGQTGAIPLPSFSESSAPSVSSAPVSASPSDPFGDFTTTESATTEPATTEPATAEPTTTASATAESAAVEDSDNRSDSLDRPASHDETVSPPAHAAHAAPVDADLPPLFAELEPDADSDGDSTRASADSTVDPVRAAASATSGPRERSARAPMTSTQRGLFIIFGLVIVIAVVLIIVFVTQRANAAEGSTGAIGAPATSVSAFSTGSSEI